MSRTHGRSPVMMSDSRTGDNYLTGGQQGQESRDQQEPLPTYTSLKEDKFKVFTSLLHGNVALSEVPRIRPVTVRVYIASPSGDMVNERHILAEQVFPELRRYCRDEYGVEFEAVDLTLNPALDKPGDNLIADLFLAELRKCQAFSTAPNCEVLLGQSSDPCPAPKTVTVAVYGAICSHLSRTGRDVTLVNQCYQCDHNVTPRVYRLLEKQDIEAVTACPWKETEAKVSELISQGTRLAVECASITEDEARPYTPSVFERDVHQTHVSVADARTPENSYILVLLLETEGQNDVRTSQRVTDVKVHPTAETSQWARPSVNCYADEVKWMSKGSGRDSDRHHVSGHLCRKLRSLLDRGMRERDTIMSATAASDPLYMELVQHWGQAAERCASFAGQEAPLMTICSYMCGNSGQPLVIYGEPGVGKTSLLAKAASAAHMWTSGKKMRMSLVFRFIRLTPNSCSLQQVLHSVCRQIAWLSGKPEQAIPENCRRLKNYFVDFLQRGEFPGLLVIVLDALDQLTASDDAHKLDWLPARIAPNVKMIVSVSSANISLVNKLELKSRNSMEQLLPMSFWDAEHVFKVLLRTARHQVTAQQWPVIQQAFHHCSLPLFIVLTLQEVLRWRSFDIVSVDALQHSVEAAAEKLFESLEARHGQVFVSRALGYVTASRSGLSASELEDLLSLDDDVLDSVFTGRQPHLQTVPPLLWPRLHREIAPLLQEKNWDGVLVLCWRHQRLAQAATHRYLRTSADYLRVHRALADYFQGARSGTFQKPLSFSQQQPGDLAQGKGSRLVLDMPLVLCSSTGSRHYNRRKMWELPHALRCSRQVDRLKSECFCSLDWLRGTLCAISVQHVLADLDLLRDRETELVAEALRMCSSALRDDPDRLHVELAGRLLPLGARYPALRELVRQCDLMAQKSCPLVPLAQLYAAPGGPLQNEYVLEPAPRSADDVNVIACADSLLLTVKYDDLDTFKVWDPVQRKPRQEMQLPVGRILSSRDSRFLCVLKDNRFISIYDADCGNLHGVIDYDYGKVSGVAAGKRYLAINTERGVGPVVVDLEEVTQVHRFTFHSQAAAIGADDDTLVICAGRLVLLYSLPLMERRGVVEARDVPQKVYLSVPHSKCYLLTRTKLLQSISFNVAVQPRAHDLLCDPDLCDFTVSHNENVILCRSARHLHVLDAHRKQVAKQLQQVTSGLFHASMTSFSAAGFSLDDRLVVAGRHTQLLVWNTTSGQLLRVLQASFTPMTRLFLFHDLDKAVTLLEDNTVQVWNFNNLDEGILHTIKIAQSAVQSVAVSNVAGFAACQGHAEVKLIDLGTGRVTGTLQHDANVKQVTNVTLSPGGRYLLTCCLLKNEEELEEEASAWSLLRCFVLWEIGQQRPIYSGVNCRFAFFDCYGTSLGVIHWVVYNPLDWTSNWYQFTFLHLDAKTRGYNEQHFDLPENSELVGCPSIFCDRMTKAWALVAVLQMSYKVLDENNQATNHSFETLVYIQFVAHRQEESRTNEAGSGPGTRQVDTLDARYVRLQDLIEHSEVTDHISHVLVLQDHLLLITYVKDVDCFLFDPSHGLIIPPDAKKGAVLYDPIKDTVLKHLPQVCELNQDIWAILVSTMSSSMLDQHLQVSRSMSSHKLSSALTELHPDFVQPLLHGRYIMGLTYDYKRLKIYRSSDGIQKASLLIHGKACSIAVAEDGRTIAVGTEDSRVMLLGFVLELSDPYGEFIRKLPSRNPPLPALLEQEDAAKRSSPQLLDEDMQVVRGVMSDMVWLSTKTQSNMTMAASHEPSFSKNHL